MAALSRLPQGWSLANQIRRNGSMRVSALYLGWPPGRLCDDDFSSALRFSKQVAYLRA